MPENILCVYDSVIVNDVDCNKNTICHLFNDCDHCD